jgi:hypothetical protein
LAKTRPPAPRVDDLDRGGLLLRVAPVDVQSGLDARSEEQRGAGLAADLLFASVGDLRHDSHDASRGVAEQVDRVFNPPGPR